jgi:hypothetical protein
MGGGLSTQREVVPKASPTLEGPRRRWATVRVISTPEVLISGDVSHPHSWGTEIVVNHKEL